MSLVLSNAFKDFLLSSYVNTKFDFKVKSFNDLIDKPKVEIIHSGIHNLINFSESDQISKLKQRILNSEIFDFSRHITNNKLTKLQNGDAIILCNSYMCSIYQKFFTNLKLTYTQDHYFHSFKTLMVKKSHSHSLKIYKL